MATKRTPKTPGEAQQFLDAMFGDVPPELYFYVWSFPGRLSTWFHADERAQAAAHVGGLTNADVYVSVACAPHDFGPHSRCPADQTAGIVALWADVDYADAVHRKPNLPADEAAALALVAEMVLAPSIVVHSGHGLQAWWLLDEPWLFKDAGERAQAAELVARWLATLRARAMVHGWTVDATHDLARVMRLPGTMNCKTTPHVPSRLLSIDTTRRYSRDDFAEHCIDEAEWAAIATQTGATYVVGTLVLRPDAGPPDDVLDALMESDAKFALTWKRQRADLRDPSQSSYDLALATFAADFGWNDQQIADLVIAHRRKHGEDMDKALRADYLQRTIAKARDDRSRMTALDDLESLGDRLVRAEQTGSLTEAAHVRVELLRELSAAFGITILRLVKLTSTPPEYRIETPTGSITMGNSSRVWNQASVGQSIADVTGHIVPTFKPQKWNSIKQQMWRAFEDENTGMESTDEGLAYSLLTQYLRDSHPCASLAEAALTEQPYVLDGIVHVFGPRFNAYINATTGEKMSGKRMGALLRSYGAHAQPGGTPVPRANGKPVNRSIWRVGAADHLGIDLNQGEQ